MTTKTYTPSLYVKQRCEIDRLKSFDIQDQLRIKKVTKAYVKLDEKYQMLMKAIKDVCTYGGSKNGNCK